MKPALTLFTILLLAALRTWSADDKSATAGGFIDAGVGIVDITPTEAITLAGSPSPKEAPEVKTRLFVRALVLSANDRKVAIVTLDTLKYPVDLAVRARTKIEQTAGIPASNVIICASHTHFGPLWSYYEDQLVTPIVDPVAQAVRDLTPCTAATAKGKAEGVSECRRVIKDGHAWNRWQLENPAEAAQYTAEGPADPEFDVLALRTQTGNSRPSSITSPVTRPIRALR